MTSNKLWHFIYNFALVARDCKLGDFSGLVAYDQLPAFAKSCDDCAYYQSLISSYVNGKGSPTSLPSLGTTYNCLP